MNRRGVKCVGVVAVESFCLFGGFFVFLSIVLRRLCCLCHWHSPMAVTDDQNLLA